MKLIPIFAVCGGLLLAGCASQPATPAIAYTGNPVTDLSAQVNAAPAKDKVLWQYRLSVAAMRAGDADLASRTLDDAMATVSGYLAGGANAEAAKSRRLFGSESNKPYAGEPYERAMADYYRAILFWMRGEPDNARALFRDMEFIDSDTENRTYAGDWVLADYLSGLVDTKLHADGSDALKRARAISKHPLPDYDATANVMLFVEYGRAPRKYSGGEYGEELRFMEGDSRVHSARLTVDGADRSLPPFDDVYYQASTRGGRVMDHILGNKAVFKQTADNLGNAAIVGGVLTSELGRGEDKDKAALALVAAGILGKITSAAANATADTRAWDNLPQYLSFAALKLAPGDHVMRIQFFDAQGQILRSRTQEFTVTVPADSRSDTVVFRSEVPD